MFKKGRPEAEKIMIKKTIKIPLFWKIYIIVVTIVLIGYAILVGEEFSCLEFDMNRDTISWIWRKNRIQEVAYGTLTEENLSKRHQLYAGR